MHLPNVVMVTGASAGVGRATAIEFARHGATVGLVARGIDGLEAAKRDVEAAGDRAVVLPADVADPAQVEDAATKLEAQFGPIDIWVNNAMVTVFSPFLWMSPEEFHRVTEVTYFGYVHGTMAALRRMVPRDHGTIVQVGSALAYRGIPLQSAYCGAKHAIQGFTESVRTELMHDGSRVHVTMVQLPGLNTPQFEMSRARIPNRPQPVPPIYQPEVAAQAVVWAATHHRRELLVGAPTITAVIGNTIAPGVADLFLAKTGYESQQTDQPVDGDRPDNLYEPLPGDHGVHGPFDAKSRRHSYLLWLTTHRGPIALATVAAAAGAFAGAAQATRNRRTPRWRRAASRLRDIAPRRAPDLLIARRRPDISMGKVAPRLNRAAARMRALIDRRR